MVLPLHRGRILRRSNQMQFGTDSRVKLVAKEENK